MCSPCSDEQQLRRVSPNGPPPVQELTFGSIPSVSQTRRATRRSALAWYQISQHYGLTHRSEANLNPYTATLQSLPPNLATSIRLPKVGADAELTEEQIRESLRRFIVEWQRLIGAPPEELSLVERTDEAGGTKVARYEQRPFRYPLRGGYGKLTIRFRNDRQARLAFKQLPAECRSSSDSTQRGEYASKRRRRSQQDQVATDYRFKSDSRR